jgi:hypothetical protein
MINRDTLKTVHKRMSNELALAEANTAAAQAAIPNEAEHNTPKNTDLDPSGQANKGLELPYYISRDQANKIYLPDFLKEPQNAADPAYKVCTFQTTK